MTTPEQEKALIRAKIDEIGQRLGTDATFRTQLEADPLAVLTAQGIPAGAAAELLKSHRKLNAADIQGYDCWWSCEWSDTGYECWGSYC